MKFSDYGIKRIKSYVSYKWEVARLVFYRWVFKNVLSNLVKYSFAIEFIFEMEEDEKKYRNGFDNYSLLNTRLQDAIDNWGMWKGREMGFMDYLIETIEEMYCC